MLGIFLSLLLHANDKAILAIYGALENRAAQLRAIESAVEATLPQDHADVISVLTKVQLRPAMKYRDKLAHWCWGYSDELPDALLIRDPKLHLESFHRAINIQLDESLPIIGVDHSSIFVVRETDFIKFANQLDDLQTHLRWAMASVWQRNSKEARGQYIQKLSNEPLIQAGLIRLREGRQKTQPAQLESHPEDWSGE